MFLPDDFWISVLKRFAYHPHTLLRFAQVNRQLRRCVNTKSVWCFDKATILQALHSLKNTKKVLQFAYLWRRNRVVKSLLQNRLYFYVAIHYDHLHDAVLRNTFTGDPMFDDRQIALLLMERNSELLKFTSSRLKNDPKVVMAAVNKDFQTRRECLIPPFEPPIYHASEGLKNDRRFILAVLSNNGYMLKYLTESQQDDPELVMTAITSCKSAFIHASFRMREDRQVVMHAVKHETVALYITSKQLQDDFEIVFTAVTVHGISLQTASKRLQNDRKIVLAAVTQNGQSLQYAGEKLQNDREIVLAAVNQNGVAICWATKALQDDPEIKNAAPSDMTTLK